MAQLWKLLIPTLGAVALFAAWFLLPVKEWLESFTGWIGELGAWGYLFFAVFYAAATVLLVPGSLLTLAAGFVFGLGWGLLVALTGAAAGASLAFLSARYLLRATIEKLVKKRRKLAAVDRAVADEGWKAVLLLRLSPLVPFNLQNYLFGLTAVAFWPYLAATLAGILPGAVLYSYLGFAGGALTDGGGWGAAQWTFFASGLAATLVVTLIVSRAAKRAMSRREEGSR